MSNKDKILNAITNSFPLAITRSELMVLTGLSDRAVRKTIEKLRHKRTWILSSPTRPGYWMANNSTEWNKFVDNWNRSNRFSMLRKTQENEAQIGIDTESSENADADNFYNEDGTLTSRARALAKMLVGD